MRSTFNRREAERHGRWAETAAAMFLRCKGYRVLAERFSAPGGEIDLVARKAGQLVFVEVKYRQTLEDAFLSVSPRNQSRIKSAAATWLARRALRLDPPMRFDIVAVSRKGLRHHRDAFR